MLGRRHQARDAQVVKVVLASQSDAVFDEGNPRLAGRAVKFDFLACPVFGFFRQLHAMDEIPAKWCFMVSHDGIAAAGRALALDVDTGPVKRKRLHGNAPVLPKTVFGRFFKYTTGAALTGPHWTIVAGLLFKAAVGILILYLGKRGRTQEHHGGGKTAHSLHNFFP